MQGSNGGATHMVLYSPSRCRQFGSPRLAY